MMVIFHKQHGLSKSIFLLLAQGFVLCVLSGLMLYLMEILIIWLRFEFFGSFYLRLIFPISTIFLINSGFFYSSNAIFRVACQKNLSVANQIRSSLGFQLLCAQLLAGLMFEILIELLSKYFPNYLIFSFCYLYPIMQGTIKAILSYFTKNFELDDIYEFAALGIAAFPYRFLFFNVDSVWSVVVVLTVKFTYKIFAHFVYVGIR